MTKRTATLRTRMNFSPPGNLLLHYRRDWLLPLQNASQETAQTGRGRRRRKLKLERRRTIQQMKINPSPLNKEEINRVKVRR